MKHLKHSHLLLIAVAVTIIGAAVFLIPQKTAKNNDIVPKPGSEAYLVKVPENADVLMIGGVPVDALCFASANMEEALPVYPIRNCDSGLIVSGDGPELGERFVTTEYKAADDEYTRGWIGYRYLGKWKDYDLIWLVENSGGSGVFTSLKQVEYTPDSDTLRTVRIIAGGDRCNGGISDVQWDGDKLYFQTDITPLGILALAKDMNEAAMTEASTSSIPSCAACCYGVAKYSGETLTGVSFDPRLRDGIKDKSYGANRQEEKCFDNTLTDLLDQKQDGFCDVSCLNAFADRIRKNCLETVR